MKPLLKRMAVGIASMAFVLSGLAATPAPSLSAFGYRNMTTKREIPLAVILVNFTNSPVNTDFTFPYKMGDVEVGANYTAAENYYSNWFFGRTAWSESVNNYFHEISNGRFQWLPAGVYMVLMDTNNLHGAFMARSSSGDDADSAYINKMVKQAMEQGFDLKSYDTFGNGMVDELECTIQLHTNDKTFGALTEEERAKVWAEMDALLPAQKAE